MPIRREIHMGWPLGQRSSEHLLQMSDGALLLARNCDIGADRSVRIRRPVKTITDMISESSIKQPIIGMHRFAHQAVDLRPKPLKVNLIKCAQPLSCSSGKGNRSTGS